jgi:threonine dehydrogenase-like Zn-dependent dehydrogenase
MFEHAHQRTRGEVQSSLVFRNKRKAYSIQRRTKNQVLRLRQPKVRRYLPKLMDLILNGTIQPGKAFDLELPLEKVAEGYAAMDERRAIKTLLRRES